MARSYLLGSDIGTQGTKTVLLDLEGSIAAESFEASDIKEGSQGSLTEDPEKQLRSVINTISGCIEKSTADPEDVLGIGIDGQMAGITAVDKEGIHCIPYDSWLDSRCADYIELMQREVGDEVLNKTGIVPSLNHGPKILWWKNEHPEIFRKIYRFTQPGSYAALRLCGLSGRDAFIDGTYLHFSGFADNAESKWDDALCSTLEVPIEKLPLIRKSTQALGGISKDMAEKTGLREGTVVAVGCGDTAASFLASGALEVGNTVDVAGTASVVSSTTSGFRPDTLNRVLGIGQSVIEGLWHPYAYINGGGMNLEWFKRFVNTKRKQELDFPDLEELAENVSVTDEVPVFVPHMSGRVMPSDAAMRGAWFGLTRHIDIGTLYFSLLEGVALEYRIYVEALRSLFPEIQFDEIRVTGGGENSRLWNRIKATACKLKVARVIGSAAAPMGSAIVAGCAAGVWNDPRIPAKEWLSFEDAALPESDLQDLYRRRYRKYRAALDFASDYARINRKE